MSTLLADRPAAGLPSPAPPPVLLETRGVSKRYGKVEVLRSVDLTVRAGEILGVIGPNGAGKSTLFNLVAGIATPSGGSILLSGRELGRLAPWRRARAGIGRTYQIPMPFQGMSVFENLLAAAVNGGAMSVAEGREESRRVLAATGLDHRAGQLAGSLTLLDLKRLELARALCLRPRLLLLDEVAGGLTDGECGVLVELVRAIRADGVTIVWVEHVLNALRRAASRMVMLAGGTILADGPCDAVLADPAVRSAYLGH